jgi:hypothetical protein
MALYVFSVIGHRNAEWWLVVNKSALFYELNCLCLPSEEIAADVSRCIVLYVIWFRSNHKTTAIDGEAEGFYVYTAHFEVSLEEVRETS